MIGLETGHTRRKKRSDIYEVPERKKIKTSHLHLALPISIMNCLSVTPLHR